MASKDELLVTIDKKISVLISLLAYQIVGGKTVTEGAPILRRLGMTPTEIASIFDTSVSAVNVRLSEARKRSSK